MELDDGIRITRASGLPATESGLVIMPCDGVRRDDILFRMFRPVTVDFRLGSSPSTMDVWTTFPRAMVFILSTSFCMGLKSAFHWAITSSIGGGGEGKPSSWQ